VTYSHPLDAYHVEIRVVAVTLAGVSQHVSARDSGRRVGLAGQAR
jgi:hypothetical protein